VAVVQVALRLRCTDKHRSPQVLGLLHKFGAVALGDDSGSDLLLLVTLKDLHALFLQLGSSAGTNVFVKSLVEEAHALFPLVIRAPSFYLTS